MENAQSHNHICIPPLVMIGEARCFQHLQQLCPRPPVDTNDVHSWPTANKPEAENGLLREREEKETKRPYC